MELSVYFGKVKSILKIPQHLENNIVLGYIILFEDRRSKEGRKLNLWIEIVKLREIFNDYMAVQPHIRTLPQCRNAFFFSKFDSYFA